MFNKSFVTNLVSVLLMITGYFSPIFSDQLKSMGLFSFSGAITNWLAIHMLFEKIPFLYGSGIVTERFEEFKLGIRNLIMNQFFTLENFEKFMKSNQSSILKIEEDSLMKAIDFDKVFEKLKGAIIESPFGAMLGMFGGEEALEPLKPLFASKFQEIIHDILKDENFMNTLTGQGKGNSALPESIKDMVDARLDELTPKMIKDIIQDMIKEHLGWLVVWGGVFGGLIGFFASL